MRAVPCLAALLALACTPADIDRHGPDDTAEPSGETGDTGAPVDGCRAERKPADRDRFAVVSFPYGPGGQQAQAWGVLRLGQDGALTDTGTRFDLGRGFGGEVVFTPDAEVGLAVQDDGTLGVFRLDDAGTPTVIHAAFDGGFYASRVVVEPSGEVAWVVDGNWANNGGGLYRVDISCDDGSLSNPERVLEAKLPADLLPSGTQAVLVGREAGGAAPAGEDAFLLDMTGSPAVVGGVDAFGDDDAIVSDAALTADGRYALIGDYSAFSGVPNRVAVVSVTETGLGAVQVLSNVDDPVALVASPWNDLVLAVSGYGDAVFVLDYDPDSRTPFSFRGEPSWTGASPQLPSGASLVDRGALKGLVLVAENQGVRRLRLSGEGAVEDLGLTPLGASYEAITGAIGVQP